MGFSVWFRGLRGKLLVMVLVPAVLLSIISVAALKGIKSGKEDLELIARKRLLITEYTGELRANVNAIGRLIWLAYAHDENLTIRKKEIEDAQSRIKGFQEVLDKYSALPLSEKGKSLLSTVQDHWKQLKAPSEQVLGLLEKNTRQSDQEVKQLMFSTFSVHVAGIVGTLVEANTLSNAINDAIVEDSEARAERINWIVLGSSVGGILALFLIGRVRRSNTKQVLLHRWPKASSRLLPI